jgi:hypothetical protein
MSLKTFFQSAGDSISQGWHKFMNWFGAKEAAVVQEAKTIIDDLAPLAEKELFAEGGALLAAAGTGLIAGTDPLVLIPQLATATWQAAKAIGLDLTKAASTTAGAILIEKAKALQAQAGTNSAG